jgi:RNA polymerase sigma-70 factor (ECF subfamily)
MNQPQDGRALDETLAGSRGAFRDLEAFQDLVARHAPRLIRFCYHLTGDWDEARDISQESFARAWSCRARYDPSRPFEPWLMTIASRLAATRRRKERRRFRAAAPGPAEEGAEPSVLLSLELNEALDQLTPRQRQAVVLSDLHGFSAGETARIIGCTASTVRVLRFLARQRLRRALAAAPSAERAPAGSAGRTS